jgi:hypothetical protein
MPNDPEAATQAEVEDQAGAEGDDPITDREELELDLMESGASEVGERIPDAATPERRTPSSPGR